jgi:membrane protein
MINALNVAYGVRERRPWWKVRLLAIGLTVALSFFMILAFVLAVGSGPLATWLADFLGPLGAIALLLLNWLAVLAAITLVIASVYHFCPDVDSVALDSRIGAVHARIQGDHDGLLVLSPSSPRSTRRTARWAR